MSPQVDAIWQQIERLEEADRLDLERRLHELTDAEWKLEADIARTVAGRRGIDQGTIDDVIEDVRYGS